MRAQMLASWATSGLAVCLGAVLTKFGEPVGKRLRIEFCLFLFVVEVIVGECGGDLRVIKGDWASSGR